MKISIISFTEKGKALSRKIAAALSENQSIQTVSYTKCRMERKEIGIGPILYVTESVLEWAGKQMRESNALIFIGACGIAVRAIAPYLTDKLHDAAVLVIDEKGQYIIPILSGHMGGANEIADGLANKIGAVAVITTATDRNGKFAIDLYAKKNGFYIVNREGIAKISAKILADQELTISVEPGHRKSDPINIDQAQEGESGSLPKGIQWKTYPPKEVVDLVITSEDRVFDAALLLRPKEYLIGMGCKKGKAAEEIGAFISEKLCELDILPSQIYALSSILQKKQEPGIVQWCNQNRIPFFTYSAKELQSVEGNFQKSSFVKEIVGVDNVCERAALKACGAGGTIILKKCVKNGMTIAIAKRVWSI